MDFATFRRQHPATRCFQRFTHHERADMAASHRLGHRQREAIGEFFFIHPLAPGLAFPTRKRAEEAAFRCAAHRDGEAA
jgi:hypothetical protein